MSIDVENTITAEIYEDENGIHVIENRNTDSGENDNELTQSSETKKFVAQNRNRYDGSY